MYGPRGIQFILLSSYAIILIENQLYTRVAVVRQYGLRDYTAEKRNGEEIKV